MSFAVIRKEAGTNFVLNPSAELPGNFAGHNGGTATLSTDEAKYGNFCYLVQIGGMTNRGINLTLATLANVVHHVTAYFHSGFEGTFQASLDSGATYNAMIAVGPSSIVDRWTRLEITIPAAQANGSTSLIIRNTDATFWRLDGIQVEATSGYFTTYIDGNQGEGYRWNGLKHASSSIRKADVRTGGRELTFKTLTSEVPSPDILAEITDDGTAGLGITGVINNTLNFALQPGAAFQNAKLNARILELEMMIEDSSIDSLDEVLAVRKELVDLWKPDAASPGQPTPFIHNAINLDRRLTIDTYYESGLDVTGGLQSNLESFTLRLLAPNPFWREDDRKRTDLDFQDTDSDADNILARIDGFWEALGTGTNGDVLTLAYDVVRGRVYVGGTFTTANGVTVNGICYWDGAANTFVAMGSGVNIAGNFLDVIKIAPNGDVWIGGNFTTVDGGASDGLGKWDVSAGTWIQFTNGAPGDRIFAIDIDSAGRIYIGGTFTNWDGDADADNIAQSTDDGANWTALDTGGASAVVVDFAIDSSDNLYVGGSFTTIGGVSINRFAKWDGTDFIALGTGVDNTVFVLTFGRSGELYVGGQFTDKGNRIVIWDGIDFQTMGVGTDNIVTAIEIDQDGIVIVGGFFSEAGGIDLADSLAGWNGSSWFPWDVDFPASGTVNAIRALDNGDMFVGFNDTGTATIAGKTTVNYTGTATVSPIITIFGTTTADSISILRWLENQTTGERLYFNMPINTEEIIVIDTRAGQVGITSSFRGTITNNPLDPGGLSLFKLLPGDNVIAAFITDTITGVEMFMDADVLHHGIEGVAV